LCPASLKTPLLAADEDNSHEKENTEQRKPCSKDSICSTNSTSSVTLKACSGCFSVRYAGKDEQKKDWKRHRPLCKALAKHGEKQSFFKTFVS